MTTARPGARGTSRAHLPVWAVLPVVITTLLLALPGALAGPIAPASDLYVPGSWNNSAVQCDFDAYAPAATVTAVGNVTSGMEIAMNGTIRETGVLAGVLSLGASASLAKVEWNAVNLSTESRYALEYYALVPVTGVAALPLGDANVSVQFSLPESSSGPGTSGDTVTVAMTIADWPWLLLYPELSANLSLAPANPATEHLALNDSGAGSLESVTTATGKMAASLAMPVSANVSTSTSPVSVISSILGIATGVATLSIDFGSLSTEPSAVEFAAPMVVAPETPTSIVVPGTHVRIPILDFAAAIAAAAVASLAIAGVTRRARRTPSDLEYVEEQP